MKPDTTSRFARAAERFGLLRPHALRLSLGYVLLLLTASFQLFYPHAVSYFIDRSVAGSNGRWILWAAPVMALVLLVHALAIAGRHYLFASTGSLVVADLRKLFFRAVVRQNVAFFDSENAGELTNRLSVDVEHLQQALTVDAAMIVQTAVVGAGGAVMLFLISPSLSLLIVVLAPLVVYSMRWVGGRSRAWSKMKQEKLAYCGRLAQEIFGNIRLVHAFTQERREEQKFSSAIGSVLRYSLLNDRLFSWLEGGATLVQSVALLVTVLVGGTLVARHALTMGELTGFILYAGMAAGSATTLGGLWGEWMRAIGATDRVFEVLADTPATDADATRPEAAMGGEIRFDSVDFSYPTRPEKPALRRFSLTIRPGETIALVGASGAGKSTVVNLLLGFYAPSRGGIFLDGADMAGLSLASVRRQTAIVEQEPALFAMSVMDNIRYGATDAEPDDADVLRAARHAHVHEFVSGFPEGYDTLVGSRGTQLSGGQKQRVAIARALLRNPRLLVLDEATSALDSESEGKVQQALRHIMTGRTTIIIAHRLSTIMFADRVVVLREGELVQCGSHRELMEADDGYYRQLVARQALDIASAASSGTPAAVH